MKKLLLTLCFFTCFLPLFGQYAAEYPLVEHFTNTRCVLCPPLNGPFYQSMDNYEGFVHHLSFHPPVPYPEDTFYRANPLPQDIRRLHYGVSGTPKAYLNGQQVRQGQALLPTSKLEQLRGKKSGMDIQLDELIIQGQMQLALAVRSLDTSLIPHSGNYRLFVVLVEDSVYFEAQNGENWHHNLFREALTSMEGEVFVPANEGGAIPFNFSYQLKSEWDSTRVHALAFVFHDSGTFINSAQADNLRVNTSSSISNNQNDGTATALARGGFPPYNYQWNDPDSQQTASATGLNSGLYLVTVTDQAGTKIQEAVEVKAVVANEEMLGFSPVLVPARGSWTLKGFPSGTMELRAWSLDGKKLMDVQLADKRFVRHELPKGIYALEVVGEWGVWRSKCWLR